MKYLLDTNVISDAVKNPGGAVDVVLRQHSADEIGTSLVVTGEIFYGLHRRQNVRGRKRLDILLGALAIWPLEAPVDDVYGRLRADMEKIGKSVGPNDLWIAAHSIALDAVLVSDDRAFLAIPNLKLENWLRA